MGNQQVAAVDSLWGLGHSTGLCAAVECPKPTSQASWLGTPHSRVN